MDETVSNLLINAGIGLLLFIVNFPLVCIILSEGGLRKHYLVLNIMLFTSAVKGVQVMLKNLLDIRLAAAVGEDNFVPVMACFRNVRRCSLRQNIHLKVPYP
jgi:hypothetical protein